jgi:hypothetical protein
MFKQVGLAAAAAMGAHLLWLAVTRQLPLLAAARRAALLVLGVVTTVAATAGLLVLHGGVAELHEAAYATFVFNRAYFAVGDSTFGYNPLAALRARETMFPYMQLPLLMAAAAVLHGVLRWAHRTFRPDEVPPEERGRPAAVPAYLLLVTLWFLLAMYGAFISPQKYRWYLAPVLPPLLLLAGYLIDRIQSELSLLQRLQKDAWAAAAIVIMAYFGWACLKSELEQANRVWAFRYDYRGPEARAGGPAAADAWRSQREWEVIGNALLKHVPPGAKVQCWGWLPGVYFHTHTLNASRFATTEKYGQVGTHAEFVLREIADALEHQVPDALAIRSQDYEWAWGRDRTQVAPSILHGPLIDKYYERVDETRSPNAYIFIRRAVPATSP